MEVVNITTDRNQHDIPCGSNVQNITLYSNLDYSDDTPSVLDADEVLENVRLTSDKVIQDTTFEELINKRMLRFENQTQSIKRGQSHVIFSSYTTDLDNVRAIFDFRSGKINNNENYVVICRYKMNADLTAKTSAKLDKQMDANASKVPTRS